MSLQVLNRFRRGWVAGAAAALVMGAFAFVAAPQPSTASASAETAQIIELTNAERARAGLGPVSYNPNLTHAAESYASVLASTGCWSHNCPPLTELQQRIEAAGYWGWVAIGENLAAGSRSPQETMDAWMKSPTHRSAILNPAYTEVGVAVAYGGQYGIYWTQEFGARGGVQMLQPVEEDWGSYWGWD